MTRVQIPVWSDRWMRGDRYGEVVRTYISRYKAKDGSAREIAVIKLDKSGKVVSFPLADCEVLS